MTNSEQSLRLASQSWSTAVLRQLSSQVTAEERLHLKPFWGALYSASPCSCPGPRCPWLPNPCRILSVICWNRRQKSWNLLTSLPPAHEVAWASHIAFRFFTVTLKCGSYLLPSYPRGAQAELMNVRDARGCTTQCKCEVLLCNYGYR